MSEKALKTFTGTRHDALGRDGTRRDAPGRAEKARKTFKTIENPRQI